MKNFTLGVLAGFVLSFLVGSSLLSLDSGDSVVVEKLRLLEPNMSIQDVEDRLGKPNNRFEIGEGTGQWKSLPIPSDYCNNHGALLYVLGDFAPQVLFIFFDENGRVTFLTCERT